jgi:hypothetical protein
MSNNNFFNTEAIAKSAKPKFERKDYGTPDEGTHEARIVQVIMLGEQERQAFKGEQKPPIQMMRVTFELPFSTIERVINKEGDTETQPRWISHEFPVSSFDQSTCMKWGKILGFGGDWSKAIGMPCQIFVQVQQGKKDPSKYYAKVKDLLSMSSRAAETLPEIHNPDRTLLFSPRDGSPENVAVFNEFPEWLQGKIEQALDFHSSGLKLALDAGVEPAETPKPKKASTPKPKAPEPELKGNPDDDAPFDADDDDPFA